MMRKRVLPVAVLAMAPLLGGADGDGCSTFSTSPAPDMSGNWDVDYQDDLLVTIELGGGVYTETIGAAGGTVTIDHEGTPIEFDLDCANEQVVCPSEVWPSEVGFRQDDEMYPHRIYLQVPKTECMGELVAPEPSECGADTPNPDCDMVCDGEVAVVTQEAYGEINEPGTEYTLLLGAGVASNGVNCVLLGGSIARGDLTTTGTAEDGDWEATATDGSVITHYAGGCLWAGDVDDDGTIEGLVVGASVRLETSYSAMKQ